MTTTTPKTAGGGSRAASAADGATPAKGSSARVRVQKFGTFLSGMIMPNIAAFIAWGLITAFFIEVGWTPLGPIGGFGTDPETGETYTGLVGPMIRYMLPLLIAAQGGRMVHGVRGTVVAVVATMGVIVSTGQPMFLGAMIMGPLAAYLMKQLDKLWDDKIRPGFEMLVNNFTAGIFGAIMAIVGYFVVGPVVSGLSRGLGAMVDFLTTSGLLPLTALIIEPAKILFLNNAINQGVLTPLGIQQAQEAGKSILFLLEANPGPGLGLLVAYIVFGTGMAKSTAPAAAIIHFFGGIHEIYFPYVLMKPLLLVAMIPAGIVGIGVNSLFDVGLRSPAAPGSILAVYAAVPGDSVVGVTLSVLAAAATSFLISAVILRASKDRDGGDLAAATASMEAMKGKKSSVSAVLNRDEAAAGGVGPDPSAGGNAAAGVATSDGTIAVATDHDTTGGAVAAPARPVHDIVFACDAGMGSSAMGASVLRNKIKKAGFSDVTVKNLAIANLTDEPDLIVTHQDLTERARGMSPSAQHVSVDNFLNSPQYDAIVEQLRTTNTPPTA